MNTRQILTAIYSIMTMVLLAGTAHGLEPYRSKKTSGVMTFVTNYYILGNWHMKYTWQTTGRGQGTKWIQVGKTSGETYPGTGFYKTGGADPVIELWKYPSKAGDLTIKVGYSCLQNTKVTLKVGGKQFDKVWGSGSETREWRGPDSNTILRTMLSNPKLDYSYIGGSRKRHEGTTDLAGLKEIMEFGYELVGYNPFEKE